jgi:hypothetical protein
MIKGIVSLSHKVPFVLQGAQAGPHDRSWSEAVHTFRVVPYGVFRGGRAQRCGQLFFDEQPISKEAKFSPEKPRVERSNLPTIDITKFFQLKICVDIYTHKLRTFRPTLLMHSEVKLKGSIQKEGEDYTTVFCEG